MSTLQARHRGHNIPDGVTAFNEIEYDREGGVFLNKPKLILLAVIVFLLTLFSAFLGRYSAQHQVRQKTDAGVADSQIPFLAVEPESYRVFLDPKLYAADGTVSKHDVEYSGRVEVIFRPKTDTSVVSLHVGLLTIDGKPTLKRRLSMDTPTDEVLKDDSEYELDDEVNAEQETLTVTVTQYLKAGHYYSLFVNFTGTIGRDPATGGFFKVVFDDTRPVRDQWYVATKLTPHKARNLLPCVDNPKHKAFFEMSVVRSKETSVVFNTKVKTTESYKDNLLIDHFEKTGLIRPDSLGLFMSNFKSNIVPTDSSVELTVWSPESTESTEIITDVVPKTLDYMSTYLATDFPTNKLDIVVVPSAVVTSAESPGLIVIKDSVLATKKNSSITYYQKSAQTIVTHIIRQWLMPLRGLDRGNNNDKWLNEAIVNFLKIINMDYIKPSWNTGARFPLDEIRPVMFYDSWTNSDALASNEHHTEIYKYISSSKGTSILRMLNYTFTEDIFKQTLREYIHIEIYKYKDTISFWTLLDDNARNKSIKLPESSAVLQIVNTWMQNKNYPMVKLLVDGDDLVLKQYRFDYDEPKPTNDWVIPVTLTSGKANSTTVWLENNPEIRVAGYVSASNGTWILANQHQTGYFRVAYEDVLLDRISYEMNKGESFDEYTVAQLIEDIFEGAFAGVIGFSDALGFLERAIQKAGPYAGLWDAVYSAFDRMEAILHHTKYYNNFSIYMTLVAQTAYDIFHNNKLDTADKIIGKMDALSFGGRVESRKSVSWAKRHFDEWKKSKTEINPIVPNYRKAVYCTVLQYATRHDLVFITQKYKTSEWAPDRKEIIKSFHCSRNPHFLNLVLLEDGIVTDDVMDVWQTILDEPGAGPHAFNHIRNNWEALYQEYSSSNVELLSTMLHAAIRGLNTLADLDVLQIFNEKYFSKTLEDRNPVLLEVIRFEEEVLRQKIIWSEKYQNAISSWISPKAIKAAQEFYKIEFEQNNNKLTKSENSVTVEGESALPTTNNDDDAQEIEQNSSSSDVSSLPVNASAAEGPKENATAVNNNENEKNSDELKDDKTTLSTQNRTLKTDTSKLYFYNANVNSNNITLQGLNASGTKNEKSKLENAEESKLPTSTIAENKPTESVVENVKPSVMLDHIKHATNMVTQQNKPKITHSKSNTHNNNRSDEDDSVESSEEEDSQEE